MEVNLERPLRSSCIVEIDPNLCKACGICMALCPRALLEADATGIPKLVNRDECSGCRVCELHCPDFAISIECTDAVGQLTADLEEDC